MKGHSFIFAALLAATCFTAQAEDRVWNIDIENPSNKAKVDEPVVLDLRQLLGDNSMFCVKSAIVMDEGTEIPSQLDDMNGDLRFDEMAFVINLPAKSKKTVSVTLSSEKARSNISHAHMRRYCFALQRKTNMLKVSLFLLTARRTPIIYCITTE